MPMQGGIYTLSKSAPTGFTPLGVIRKAAYEEINSFAKSNGKVAQVVSVNEVPAGFAKWPQVEVRFRLVDGDNLNTSSSPEIVERISSVYDSDGRPIDTERVYINTTPKDVYKELERLGELRDKKILTEEEFEREKKKLLESEK